MSTSATNEMFHGGFLESDRGEILFSRQTDRYHNNLHYRERAVERSDVGDSTFHRVTPKRQAVNRLLMFIGMTVGGYIGWWAGEYLFIRSHGDIPGQFTWQRDWNCRGMEGASRPSKLTKSDASNQVFAC